MVEITAESRFSNLQENQYIIVSEIGGGGGGGGSV